MAYVSSLRCIVRPSSDILSYQQESNAPEPRVENLATPESPAIPVSNNVTSL